MENEGRCPSCNKPLDDKHVMLPERMIELIRRFAPGENYALCTRCGGGKLYTASTRISFSGVDTDIEPLKPSFPLLTLPLPPGWEYEPITFVTENVVVGAGAFTAFGASMSEVFGGEAPEFMIKIRKSIDACSVRLITKALASGANAVIDLDIGYSGSGGAGGLIMIGMTGTAVNLKNLEVLGAKRMKALKELKEKLDFLNRLEVLRSEYQAFSKEYKLI
jgi:uncharacterized protein YbjQ (UPF0145 family)